MKTLSRPVSWKVEPPKKIHSSVRKPVLRTFSYGPPHHFVESLHGAEKKILFFFHGKAPRRQQEKRMRLKPHSPALAHVVPVILRDNGSWEGAKARGSKKKTPQGHGQSVPPPEKQKCDGLIMRRIETETRKIPTKPKNKLKRLYHSKKRIRWFAIKQSKPSGSGAHPVAGKVYNCVGQKNFGLCACGSCGP